MHATDSSRCALRVVHVDKTKTPALLGHGVSHGSSVQNVAEGRKDLAQGQVIYRRREVAHIDLAVVWQVFPRTWPGAPAARLLM